MAAIEAPVEALNDVTSERPLPEAGGVLVNPIGQPWPEVVPMYSTTVLSTGSVKAERLHGYGTVWRSKWTMSDGTGYKVFNFEPEHLKTEVPVVDGTQLGTQPDGYDTDVDRKILLAGMRVLLVGPEIGASIPLSHTAHNVHTILNEVDRLGYFTDKRIAVNGYSRSAMYGFGLVAIAGRFNREIVDAHLIDPCVAKPTPFTVQSAKEVIPRLPGDALNTVRDIGKIVANPVRAYHYRNSVDVSPSGFRQFRDTLAPLVTGEAGYLASMMSADEHAIVSFYARSVVNHAALYRTILNKNSHPNVDIHDLSGGHLAATRQKVLHSTGAYYTELANQLRDREDNSADLDYTRLHAPAA